MHALGVLFFKEVTMKDLALYIHIPFCEKKCYYCDFTSFSGKDDQVSKYTDYVIKEMSLYKEKINQEFSIKSIFIGGGTPSSIHEDYIEKILNYIYENYPSNNIEEITIEINPGSLTLEKAQKYKELGINRVSIGLQSLDNRLLKSIGRIHNSEDFYESYQILKDLGFKNISVDLMFGLPDQSLQDLYNTLKEIVLLDLTHISLYSLIIEEGTLFYKWEEENKIKLPSEELDREMYHSAVMFLNKNGYKHYEISNFAKGDFQCVQNMTYWSVEPYLGIGINSHSNLDHKRFSNLSDFETYYKKIDMDRFPIHSSELISKEMEIAEYIILGLRLIKGIDKNKFKNRFNMDINHIYKEQILKNIKDGLLFQDENHIKLTSYGLDLANRVELDFFP